MIDNSTITPLRGPDRVRKRPAVLFGSAGVEGAVTAVTQLASIFITEAIRGHSNGIHVTVHQDGSVTLLSYDRGFLLSETLKDGKPTWYHDFCELYPRAREAEEGYAFQLGQQAVNFYGETELSLPKYPLEDDHGLYLCAVQYASRFMQVESVCNRLKKTLRFEKGIPASNMIVESTTEEPYTRFHFLLDTDVFEDTCLPTEEIARFLQVSAATVARLSCTFSDERNGFFAHYHYPNGAQDYAAAEALPVTPWYTHEIEAVGKDRYNRPEYTAHARLVFAFVEQGSGVQCFHNYRALPYGGTHLNALKEKILTLLQWDFKEATEDFSLEKIQDRVFLLLETKSTHTFYENGTRQSIGNRMLTDMASDLAGDDFRHYLKLHHETIARRLK